MKPLGIYIHIPFCETKCPYCDFYSMCGDEKKKEEYIQTVIHAMKRVSQPVSADTLYIGGGTPTLIDTKLLAQVIQTARSEFSLSGEITLEANPCSVTESMLRELRRGGFNRISFGIQSAVGAELRRLGRRHSPEQAAQAVAWAKKAGFENISVDIMLGIPGQTIESISDTLKFVAQLGVQHISAYLLKIEPGTSFDCEEIRRSIPDEDESSDIYLYTCSQLEKMGFSQYEISNFSLPGMESKHNLKYWQGEEYLGFGPSAHGFYCGKRYYYPRSIDEYICSGGENALLEEQEVNLLEEAVLLGLRLKKGISPKELEKRFSVNCDGLKKKAELYISYGYMEQKNEFLSLTPRGFLLSNRIIADMLSGIS